VTATAFPLAIVALIAAAMLLPAAGRWGRPIVAWAAAAGMGLSLAILAPLVPAVLSGGRFLVRWGWLGDWGLDLSFRLDGLGLLFAVLVLGIGLLVVLYAAYYLPASDRLVRFYALLLVFAAGMLGVVLSENLVLLAVFWEITSIASFLLIAYKWEAHDARIGARMALAVTGGGGLALLAGLLLLGHMAGSFELSQVLTAGERVREHALYPLMLVLVLLGAFTKSAQFPFHFWLPTPWRRPPRSAPICIRRPW
jgi:multicomponent K+:H+ antiporter subunit A